MVPLVGVVAIYLAALGVLIFQGVALYFAVRIPHIYPMEGSTAESPRVPKVSVVVAARNEEGSIGRCLDDLLGQEYPGDFEVVVVDGGSVDATRAEVRARGTRVRLLEEPPLPSGWVGKNFACYLGASQTTGEFLLFVDADMQMHRRAVWTVAAWAKRERADLASFGSRILMVGFWENVVMPFYTQAVLTYFRAPRVNSPDSRAAMANGQFMLVRRSAYDAVGGHSAIKSFVAEDIQLARLFRSRGFRLSLGWAPELLATRMFRGPREMFEGLLRNVHDTKFYLFRQIGFFAALAGLYLAPLGVLPFGIATGSTALAALGAFLYIALFGKHAVFANAVRGRALYGLLYPIAVGYYLVLVVESIRAGLRGRAIVWKGRSYAR